MCGSGPGYAGCVPEIAHTHTPYAHALRGEAEQRAKATGRSAAWHEVELLAELRRAIPDLLVDAGGRARQEGATWAELAEALGVATPTAARQQLDPAARARQRDYRRPEPGQPRKLDALPGVSVPEAARRLGITPSSVYGRVRRGTIGHTVVDGRWIRITDPAVLGLPPRG